MKKENIIRLIEKLKFNSECDKYETILYVYNDIKKDIIPKLFTADSVNEY